MYLKCKSREKFYFSKHPVCKKDHMHCTFIIWLLCRIGFKGGILIILIIMGLVCAYTLMQDKAYELLSLHNQNKLMSVHIDKEYKKLDFLFNKMFQPMIVTATGYCPCDKCINVPKYRDGKTASMKPVKVGYIAVDTSVIPFGSEVYIEEMGVYTAEDRGAKIKGNKIDIFFNTHEEALKFGVKRLHIWIKRA